MIMNFSVKGGKHLLVIYDMNQDVRRNFVMIELSRAYWKKLTQDSGPYEDPGPRTL